MAMQHHNYVEEIWVTLDKDMKVVSVNALSNLDLLIKGLLSAKVHINVGYEN